MATSRRRSGALAGEIEPYRWWLTARGHTPQTVRLMLRELSQLGLWLQARGLPADRIDAGSVRAMFEQRKRDGHRIPGRRGMLVVEGFLRHRGLLVEPAAEPGELDVLLDRFRSWMVDERNLADTTVLRYGKTAHRFLTEQAMPAGRLNVSGLTGADVNAFLLRESARVSAGSAKGRVAELRALLRYLHVGGLIGSDLSAAVPPVGGWRLATIPRLVSQQDIERVVAAPDPATVNGARDRAILLLVARLGLRCVEVEHLRLDDIDWRSGEITIRGKARREDRMPLPAEVGQAISAYLALRGVHGPGREVFWTCRAPRKPIGRELVSDVVRDRCGQVGVAPFGAHRMRHALARQMLRGGADLTAISQVLRHQDLATTAVYAKVDLDTLRLVAQPWPETAT